MKRVFWFGIGTVAGATGTVWAERKVRARIDAMTPDQLVIRAGRRAGSAGRSLLDAVAEGRDAMRSRESELKSRYHVRHPNEQAHATDHYRPRSASQHRH